MCYSKKIRPSYGTTLSFISRSKKLINSKNSNDEKFEGTCERYGVYGRIEKSEFVGGIKTKTIVLKSENSKKVREINYKHIK